MTEAVRTAAIVGGGVIGGGWAARFLLNGIDVTRYKFVAIKSSAHFRAGFEPIAHKIIRVDTPGLVSVDLATFGYQRLERPVWPLDADAAWSAAGS